MIGSVKIGPYTYKVRLISASLADVLDAEGALDRSNKIIYIDKRLEGLELAETFLHEVYHGMYLDLGLAKDMEEESLVTLLARGHMEFIKDNPEALEWIVSLVKE